MAHPDMRMRVTLRDIAHQYKITSRSFSTNVEVVEEVIFIPPPPPPPPPPSQLTTTERRSEAKIKGYEGSCCSECGNFSMVRNGTCLKCETCGATSGCS